MGTFHSAKGLEFDAVFLVGMERVSFRVRSTNDERQIEENGACCT